MFDGSSASTCREREEARPKTVLSSAVNRRLYYNRKQKRALTDKDL